MLHETRRGWDVCWCRHQQTLLMGVGRKRNKRAVRLALTALFLVIIFLPLALQADDQVPTVNGLSLNIGYTYDPSDSIWFSQVSIFRIYDYDSIWPHKAPEYLRFKVEGNLGGARMDNSDLRMMASVNIFAMLYLAGDGNSRVRPYVEAGIGGIYTDYRVAGQDYRFNFNPQAGIGMELDMGGAYPCFASLRVHHLSNGGIGASNRGQNSVVCLFGRYF